MGKITLLGFLVVLASIFAMASFNTETVLVNVPLSGTYETPKFALMLFPGIIGAGLVFIYFFIRDTKRTIDTIQLQKRQKKDARIQELYARASNALLGNKEEEALEALKAITKENPDHPGAMLRLGDIALRNEDWSGAYNYYKNARDLDPKNLQALLSMSKALEKMGHDDGAVKALDELLDRDSNNLTALYNKRAIFEKHEKWDELLTLQKAIIKLVQNEKERQREERKNLGYKYEYGRASFENDEFEKADKAFRSIIKTDPAFLPANLGIVEIMLAQNEKEEAINFLEKGYETLRSPIIMARLEDLLISSGEPGRLIRYYNNAVSRSPQDQALKFMLGKLYFRLEMVDDAMEILDAIDTNIYATPELHNIRGELYLRRNQVHRAVEEFRVSAEMKNALNIPYCCSVCGFKAEEWTGRCPDCREWNSFTLDVTGSCRL